MQLLAEYEKEPHAPRLKKEGIRLILNLCHTCSCVVRAVTSYIVSDWYDKFIELLRDAFGDEKFCHVLVAELKDPPPQQDSSSQARGKLSLSELSHTCIDNIVIILLLYYYK